MSGRRRLSARGRVALATSLTLAVTIALLVTVAYFVTSRALDASTDRALMREAESYQAAVKSAPATDTLAHATRAYLQARQGGVGGELLGQAMDLCHREDLAWSVVARRSARPGGSAASPR